MKKCKLALVGLLLVLSMGVLVACGNEKMKKLGVILIQETTMSQPV